MCRKKKRVIHPRYHSPCQTPYTALRSLLSVALSSGMVKSNLIIPFISDKVNVQPFRRHCSVISDEGVQFKTARVFNSTAIFSRSSEIEIVGVCTDICVISNALILKAVFPEIDIIVDASCCAGVTPETHRASLTAMKACQVNIIGE